MTNDDLTFCDLRGEEIELLIRYRLMSDKNKEKLHAIIKEIETDNSKEK